MKQKSRKLALLYVILILATVGAFVPPLLVWILTMCGKNVPPLQLLGSTEWVSLVTLVVSTYFGSNVWEKQIALSNGISPNQLDAASMQIKGSPQGTTAQQVNVQVDVNQPDPQKEALRDALKHGKL